MWRSTLALLGLWCCTAATAQEARLVFPPEQIPRFNIPRMVAPPVLDGRIGDDEWRTAAKVMGVVWTSSLDFRDRPVSFWVAWDEQHLYLAARSDILPGHRLYRSHRERYDSGVVHDDAYEFGLFLHDRNRLVGEHSSFLKIVTNSLGSSEFMKLYPSIGQNMFNWQPAPRLANSVYEADGRRWWDMEMVLSLADVQMPRPHRAGDPLDLLLAAPLKNPEWQWLDFPSASGHLVHFGFPRAVLTASEPWVQIEDFGGLHDRRLRLRASVHNPGAAPVSVRALASVDHGTAAAQPAVNAQRELTVPAQGRARFDVDTAFAPGDYSRREAKSTCAIRFLRGDTPLYSFTCTFRDSDKAYLKAVPRTTPFDASIQYNPVSNKLAVSGDTLDAQVPAGSRPAALTWRVATGDKVVRSGRVTSLVHAKYEDLVSLPPLAPGRHQVTLALVDQAGESLVARDDLGFDKRDEPKEFAAWWGNKLGDTAKLLAPFEALRVGGDEGGAVVTCTRREYRLDGLGLPRQIVANGGGVLARPACVVLAVGGREVRVAATGRPVFTRRDAWRVEFRGQAQAAGVAFGVQGWMEQDGLVDLALTFAPQAGPVLIEALWVEWPVDDRLGSWMSCIGGVGGNYAARSIGKVPAGQGTVWNTRDDLGKVGSTMLVGNWESNLWVGNEQRGLLWCADSDRGWVPDDRTAAHSLVRRDGAVEIRNHLITLALGGRPFVLAAPRTVQLQYNATPFRHLARGWRHTQVSAANGFSSPEYKYDEQNKREWFSLLSMPSADPARWPYYLAKYKVRAEEKAQQGWQSIRPRLGLFQTNQIALRGYMDKTLEQGLYAYFGADWLAGNESLNPSYRDYMTWLMDRHMREGGCTHYYFDISFSRSTAAPIAGFGYRLSDGRVQPTSMDGTLREWYKRVWALMQEHGLYPGGVSGHATNSICLRALPFADAILDSEYPMPDPISTYPADRMIAMSCPHAFGVKIDHLGFMNPAWAALHDAGMGDSGGALLSPGIRHFGIVRDDIVFVPYWRNQKLVRGLAPGVLASLWTRPGGALVEVLNYGPDAAGAERSRAAVLTLDLRALGVPADARGERVRVAEVVVDDGWIAGRYLGQYRWFQDLPAVERWRGSQEVWRRRPPATPRIDAATGRFEGGDLGYHDARFFVVTWDEQPIRDAAWRDLLTGADRAAVLDWGLNRPGTRALSSQDLAAQVKVESGTVQVDAWQRPASVLLRVANTGARPTDAVLALDLARLGVNVRKLWAEYAQCLGGTLDHATGRLTVKGLAPGAARVVFVERL